MLRAFGCLLVIAAALSGSVSAGDAGSRGYLQPAQPTRTEVIRWSPFDVSGRVKRTLHIKTIDGGCGDASGSEMIGGIGYRCGFAPHYLIQTCWAASAGPTDSAICATAPWDQTVLRLRVGARFLFDEGVTYLPAWSYPWALELADGNRCLMIATGTGPIPTPDGRRTDRYICAHGINLAEPLHRGRLWTAAAARWSRTGWKVLGYLPIRRAFLPGLPPAMRRQNSLAARAARVAPSVALTRVKHEVGNKHFQASTHRLRLAFPAMTWANVAVRVYWGDLGERDVSVILHRTSRGWAEVAPKDVCSNVPLRARAQLLEASSCRR